LSQPTKYKHAYISREQLEQLTAGARVIEKDRRGDKVLELNNGHIFKIFTSRSRLSKSWWLPYSINFARNAQLLVSRSIPTIEIRALYKLPDPGKTAVEYQPLPGNTLDKCIAPYKDKDSLSEQLGDFMAELHSKGIYFRAVHPGNILLDNQGRWGLIDIADLRYFKSPLSQNKRLRNFHHLLRRQRFFPYLKLLNGQKLISSYCHSCGDIDDSQLHRGLQKIWHHYLENS